ncbi:MULTISPECIES: peroxiredoxin [Piscirickettsiaceae]|jgi:peroxiredoxin Q/BCP|uniref:thioredoxin-dependent peroxiredoxin n=1 Tax=Hydrogenovibrio thermophilus TaxID=265883 RepID=A0A410H4D6_9GAMM|nr:MULTISPECIES: peroxiredoxin [Piscirickettsiaceae]AZR81794.1 alkyl hydroperoxide reductase [Thiomicrospira sp. S5]QAB15680.1 peroxiredoxin [Hydrogenovibrio thermophilus]
MTDKARLGESIPAFSLPATNDRTITDSDFSGHYTILYFYPKDNTPGCTTEGQDFSAAYAELKQLNAQVFGVSKDSIRKHENFKAKFDFPFDLISDPDETLCNIFDVIKLKKNYGREYMGIERSTFLISPEGKLIHEWRKVKVKEHVKEVMDTLKTLSE